MKKVFLQFVLFFWNRSLNTRKLFLPLFRLLLKVFGKKSIFIGIENECRAFNKELTDELKNDMLSSLILYGSSPKEYFLYGFPRLNAEERDTFLTDHYREQVLKREIGIQHFKNELINKYGFYQRNKDFFGRECILVTSNTKFEDFRDFLKRADGKIFIKDNRGSFGSDGRVIFYENDEQLLEDLKKIQNAGHEWIAEEFISQDDRLSCWNKSSVNTIRIPSYLTPEGPTIFRPFIRTGRVGSFVDNAGVGGIFATINESTGEIITDGADEHGNFYVCHPDSRIVYKGWKVPLWKELLAVAKNAHLKMPDNKYVAYDFALTSSGWVMVEGNWGQYMCQQTSTRKGQKEGFLRLMGCNK